jgi:hypothetical protein
MPAETTMVLLYIVPELLVLIAEQGVAHLVRQLPIDVCEQVVLYDLFLNRKLITI